MLRTKRVTNESKFNAKFRRYLFIFKTSALIALVFILAGLVK